MVVRAPLKCHGAVIAVAASFLEGTSTLFLVLSACRDIPAVFLEFQASDAPNLKTFRRFSCVYYSLIYSKGNKFLQSTDTLLFLGFDLNITTVYTQR